MATMLTVSLILACFLEAGPAGDSSPERKKIDLPDFPEGAAYMLGRLSNEELTSVERSEPVYLAILIRQGLDMQLRKEAIARLAKIRNTDELAQVLDGIVRADQSDDDQEGALGDLTHFLLVAAPEKLGKVRSDLVEIATGAKHYLVRQAGFGALILSDGAFDPAWRLAEKSPSGPLDLLAGVPLILDPAARAALYPKVRSLVHGAANSDIRQAAILAIVSIPGHEEETFAKLASFIKKGTDRDTAIEAMRKLPSAAWTKSEIPDLTDTIVKYATGVAPEQRNTPPFKSAVQLARQLASLLPAERGRAVRKVLSTLGIQSVTVRVIPNQLLFDRAHIVVQAGRPIEITLENPGIMPHNFVVVAPGAMREIGLAADRMLGNPADTGEKMFVPDSEKVLHATEMVGPRKSATLTFVAPEAIGEYPYICTFPGHWVRMNGILHVVEDVEAWIAANPDKASGAQPLARAFVREWKLDDLVDDLGKLDRVPSLERGRELFTAISCAACHQVHKVGGLIGPKLAEVAQRLKPAEMLVAILEPSQTINKDFQTWVLQLEDGRVVSGIITEQNDESIHLVENPLANTESLEIDREMVTGMKPSNVSTMPMGLLNTLSRPEILDLLAYIRSESDP